jgi:hypothetical protein
MPFDDEMSDRERWAVLERCPHLRTMTIKEMQQILEYKGHSRTFAESEAKKDFEQFFAKRNDCSICRGTFTDFEYKYHYHPCE